MAQQVDINRGRVLGTDTLPIPNVLVTATTLSGNVSRTARTAANGRYTISFPGGEGDYWITFSGIGLYRREFLDGWRGIVGDAPGANETPPRFKLRPLFDAAIARGAITGQRHDGRWTDVGTPERLAALDAALR